MKRYAKPTVTWSEENSYQNGPTEYWVLASDHDRVVAEHVKAMQVTEARWRKATDDLLMETTALDQLSAAQETTIAQLRAELETARRVLEMCKKAFEHHEYLSDAKFEYMEKCRREIAAIENSRDTAQTEDGTK